MSQFMPMVDTGSFKQEYLFKSHYFIRNDDLALHYLDEGHGAPVVMVHGNPTWSFMYRHLIKNLSPEFRCLVPDHMGMGLSSRPPANKYNYRLEDRINDFSLLMEHWKLAEPAHLIVHDWGGPIALAWAGLNPEKVASITLMNTSAFTPKGEEALIPWRLKAVYNSGPIAKLLALKANLFVRGAVRTNTYNKMSKTVKLGYSIPYAEQKNRLAILRFVQDIPLNHHHPSYNLLLGIENGLENLNGHPILLVWGLRDAVFKADFLTHWQKKFPHAQAVPLARAGHWLLEDEPEIALNQIRFFLNSNLKPNLG